MPSSAPPSGRKGPVRLLHIHGRFDDEAAALRTVAIANRFGPACAHSIVSRDPGATAAARRIARGIPVLQLNMPRLAGRPSLRGARELAAGMRGYDLVLTHGTAALNAVFARTLFGPMLSLPPLVHHEDGLEPDESERGSGWRNAFRMLALARAQALVVTTPALEALALAAWKQPREKVHRIASGIDTRAFDRKPARTALPRLIKRPGELWLGTLATLHPGADLPALVRAFAIMPEPWQLVIVGEGPGRDAIAAEAARLDLSHRVHLIGAVPDPAVALGLFDLFALTSAQAQPPTALVEAMSAGLAVAGPVADDTAATVASANGPFLTGPGDEAGLADALASLAADPRRRRTIGAENRTKARAEYDESAMAGRYAALYAQVLGRPQFP